MKKENELNNEFRKAGGDIDLRHSICASAYARPFMQSSLTGEKFRNYYMGPVGWYQVE